MARAIGKGEPKEPQIKQDMERAYISHIRNIDKENSMQEKAIMFQKFIAILWLCVLCFTQAGGMTQAGAIAAEPAGQDIFPVAQTGVDGLTRYGYLDEAGQVVLPFIYTQAGEFTNCGLAVVENDQWQTAVIDRQGNTIIPYLDSPLSVDFSDDTIAYRYGDRSVYYDFAGKEIGSYAGAIGFYSNGRLLYKEARSGLYRYLETDNYPAFTKAFIQAGVFVNGLAVVQTDPTSYAVIDTTGAIYCRLPSEAAPVYNTIYGGDVMVVTNGQQQALYSVKRKQYITEYVFQELSAFQDDGFAMARQSNLWGIIDKTGRFHTTPQYHYLSYMGDGLYAARSQDGSAAAVDSDGNIIYRALTYIGGFEKMKYGLAWHGTIDGRVVFFKRNGGYYANLSNAENPVILSESVVCATQDDCFRYINLDTGDILFEQPTVFELEQGITVKTVHYEKFIGYQPDGTAYGWDVEYPEIQHLPDPLIQKQINETIREFFLKGPSFTAEYAALEGGYGVSLEGSVLVVSANCISGKGIGASVWNNSLAFDLNTGEQYNLRDLLYTSYVTRVQSLLPSDHPFYLYSFPRMSSEGVTYYYNEYESDTQRARTESFLLTFDQLGNVVNRQGACYQALQAAYERPADAFVDVTDTHWAYAYIQSVYERGLMQGSDGHFRPDDTITAAEVCVTLARLQNLDILPMNGSAWYMGAVHAMWEAGLLNRLEGLSLEAPISRADTMQFLANIRLQKGSPPLIEADYADVLGVFSDWEQLPENRLDAAAICVWEQIIEGSGGKLNPQSPLTRAAFAKLLTVISQ